MWSSRGKPKSNHINQGVEVVVDTLLLIGSDHVKDVRRYVRSKLSNYKPELISLESGIDFDSAEEILPGPKIVKRERFEDYMFLYLDNKQLVWLNNKKKAGMDYALDRNLVYYLRYLSSKTKAAAPNIPASFN